MKQKLIIAVGIFLAIGLIIYAAKPKQQNISESVLWDVNYVDFVNKNMVSGGPPKDGIPAIDDPHYVSAEQAQNFIREDERVFGFFDGKNWKALPRSIMYWHEVINEEMNGEDVSITYCPLTGSVIGYKGRYGVSGKLYNSNLVLYERGTDSEIPQILGTAVNGPSKGRAMSRFPVIVTNWKDWKNAHPDTLVLSPNTGFDRDYQKSPYPGYESLLRVWFPVAAQSDLFPTKKVVVGVEHNNEFLAIPKDEFKTIGHATTELGGSTITLSYDPLLDTIKAQDSQSNQLLTFDVYWFAWYAYHPDTKVFTTR